MKTTKTTRPARPATPDPGLALRATAEALSQKTDILRLVLNGAADEADDAEVLTPVHVVAAEVQALAGALVRLTFKTA